MPLGIVVLAAGRSKRFKSSTPKVLHPMCGRPALQHILDALKPLRAVDTVVVVPPGKVVEPLLPRGVKAVVQAHPKGTGHAAKLALAKLDPAADTVLVVPGDAPLIDAATLKALVKARRKAKASLLTAVLADPGSYGRVVRDSKGKVGAIVEAKDANSEQINLKEVNASVYAFDREALAQWLPKLKRTNTQGEYYLTDIVQALAPSVVAVVGPPETMFGTNTRGDHALAEAAMRARILAGHMDAGVTIVDPAATYIDAGVTIGADTVVRPNTFIHGATTIGSNCDIGPTALLTDCVIGDGVRIRFAEARGTRFDDGSDAGPFAYLRPGSHIHAGAHIGTFVEINRTSVGEGSKVPHQTYLGDTTVGKRVNIGAGVITSNYNKVAKHRTTIKDGAFVSINNSLVSPLTIGKNAFTGAHSMVNRDVPDDGTVYGVPARPRPRPKHLPPVEEN